MPVDGKIHFYFDFLSPFGFFGSLRVNELAEHHGIQCEWHPILLGISVLKVMGLPPIAELPLKGAYIRKDAERYARRHQLKLKRPFGSPQINPLLPARMVSWLKTQDHFESQKLAKKLYSAHWFENLDISNKDISFEIAESLDVNIQKLKRALEDGEAATLLRAEVDTSIEFGVFGSPTFRVDNELFFGVEKMEVLNEWLTLGGW